MWRAGCRAIRLVFERSTTPDHEALNLQAFSSFLSEVEGGRSYILNKIQGVSHGGGEQVPAGSANFVQMERFLERLDGPSALFGQHISEPVVQSRCIACHVEGGVSGNTRLVFEPSTTTDHEALNLEAFERFLSEVESGASLILNKIQGVSHGGGAQVPAESAEFAQMERFLGRLDADVVPAAITVDTLFEPVRMAPLRKTLRRTALIFAGRVPTEAEYASIYTSATALRTTIRNLMTGPEFHEFIIRGANDRLLTNRMGTVFDANDGFLVDFTNEHHARRKTAYENDDYEPLWRWNAKTQHGFRRAPVELIAHVVENDRPYTEILTANYIMANPFAAKAYGASTIFSDREDPHDFKPSRIAKYYRRGEGQKSEYDDVVQATRIFDPGTLSTTYPHSGVLNTTSFLFRYPTTATNRNRARARWTYYHFLGVDIESSASRTMDAVALADTNNPTMHNPACTVCHSVMDPVAGAFQDYGDAGHYRDQWGGMDSLHEFYKNEGGTSLAIEAETWNDRQVLTWPLTLEAGTETLRVVFANDFYDEDTGDDGMIYLDRLTVTNASGLTLASHEFEDLEPPVAPWGVCGDTPRNPATGKEDFLRLWNGRVDCAFFVDIEVPIDGAYNVEIVAWADRHEQYGADGFAKLAAATKSYQKGDTWYRDMRTSGFSGEQAPKSGDSLKWLARKIVADPRFAEATVTFWWPAIMGSEVAEPPAEEGDADFEGQLLAANSQSAEVRRLADGFRQGFRFGAPYNLKDLLVEMVLSEWFRADALDQGDPVRAVALRDAGARRLLTPEELAQKTATLTDYQWGRFTNVNCWDDCDAESNSLTREFRLLYGGIDSDGITERSRNVTSVMAGVAKRHAVRTSCPVVMRDFYLVPEGDRRLFGGIDRSTIPDLNFGTSFEIEAASQGERETLSLEGFLPEGSNTVRLSFTNEYWTPDADSNIHLDRLDVRDAAGRVVASYELETVEPEGYCKSPNGDNFALWCHSSLDVPINVPAAGRYTIEVVAWADQVGDALPLLDVVVLNATHSGRGAEAIRGKLVELYDKLLGVGVTPYSPDVDVAFGLFVEAAERGQQSGDGNFPRWECDWGRDTYFFDGILDDAVIEVQDDGGTRYEYDWPRIIAFADSISFSDVHSTARAWVVVLSYLLMDYRYLYL